MLSILYWRCCLDGLTGSAGPTCSFNSLLEMLVLIYPVVETKDFVYFQFSIGDAFELLCRYTASLRVFSFNSLLEMPKRLRREVAHVAHPLSILYWRCVLIIVALGVVIATVELSILYWRCAGERRNLVDNWLLHRPFNSLLEMPHGDAPMGNNTLLNTFNSLLEMLTTLRTKCMRA